MKIFKNDSGFHTICEDNNNFINFCPSRGGIITNWVFNDYQILYFDQKRFLDKSKSIRGGIPILFPICGNLERKSLFGDNFLDLMQHGFAREQEWNFGFNQSEKTLSLKNYRRIKTFFQDCHRLGIRLEFHLLYFYSYLKIFFDQNIIFDNH